MNPWCAMRPRARGRRPRRPAPFGARFEARSRADPQRASRSRGRCRGPRAAATGRRGSTMRMPPPPRPMRGSTPRAGTATAPRTWPRTTPGPATTHRRREPARSASGSLPQCWRSGGIGRAETTSPSMSAALPRPFIPRRWASTGAARSFTSSGRTKSRPSNSAQACAARWR